MQSYNCFMLSGKAWDMVDYFNSHWCLPREAYKLDKCTDCGLCEEACTQRLPVRERLKEARCELERPVTKAKEEG
jgi:predicted aldo/keto reductase-like oxidoreductase